MKRTVHSLMQQKLVKSLSSVTLVSQLLALNSQNKNEQKMFCSAFSVENAKYGITHQFFLTLEVSLVIRKKTQYVI